MTFQSEKLKIVQMSESLKIVQMFSESLKDEEEEEEEEGEGGGGRREEEEEKEKETIFAHQGTGFSNCRKPDKQLAFMRSDHRH